MRQLLITSAWQLMRVDLSFSESDWNAFHRNSASDLILIDANDKNTMSQPNAPDPTAWAIHSALHRNNPQAAAFFMFTLNMQPFCHP